MAISYKKLFKLLIDRDLKKKDLRDLTGISYATLHKRGTRRQCDDRCAETTSVLHWAVIWEISQKSSRINRHPKRTADRDNEGKVSCTKKAIRCVKAQGPYSAVITREQFLFYEMRTTARLLTEGMTGAQAVDQITAENLFQYPTEKSLRGMARVCGEKAGCIGRPGTCAGDCHTVQRRVPNRSACMP